MKPHLQMPERVGHLEDAQERIETRLDRMSKQIDLLLDVALPAAVRSMAHELGEMLKHVRAEQEQLNADKVEHAAKVRRDREKISQLALAKINEE